MKTEAKLDKVRELMQELSGLGIYNAVMAFELPTPVDGLTPHLIKHGSPMACLSLANWCASYQHEEVFEGLEVTTWYSDEDEEDEDEEDGV